MPCPLIHHRNVGAICTELPVWWSGIGCTISLEKFELHLIVIPLSSADTQSSQEFIYFLFKVCVSDWYSFPQSGAFSQWCLDSSAAVLLSHEDIVYTVNFL